MENTLNARNPIISIITVVFNSKNLIEKTIQSVINQPYEEKELIIIDGGSSDGTVDIIKKYQEKISFWKSEPDKGLYDAMNKGLLAANGDYVIFINSGDVLEKNILSKIFFRRGTDVDVFYGETNLVNEKGELLGTRSKLTTRKLPKVLTWKKLKYGMVVCHQSIFVKRAIAPLYELNYRCSADLEWVIQSLKRSAKIENTNLIISNYLVGGFSSSNQKRCIKERFKIYIKHYGVLDSLWIHTFIIFRAIFHKITNGSNY